MVLVFVGLMAYANHPPMAYKVTASIPAVKLRQLFGKDRTGELPLYLYLGKTSTDDRGEDIHLLWFSMDANRRLLSSEPGWNEGLLKKESAAYIHFLRLHGVVKEQVALGYEVNISSQVLRDLNSLDVSIWLRDGGKTHIVIGEPSMTWIPNDTCKIPPGCGVATPEVSETLRSLVTREYSKK